MPQESNSYENRNIFEENHYLSIDRMIGDESRDKTLDVDDYRSRAASSKRNQEKNQIGVIDSLDLEILGKLENYEMNSRDDGMQDGRNMVDNQSSSASLTSLNDAIMERVKHKK
jgi:hypothetical protein